MLSITRRFATPRAARSTPRGLPRVPRWSRAARPRPRRGATAPDVLLLDEPLAGMGAEEAHRMVDLLKKLTPDHAILLVEHDMDAVFAVADTITVMVNGLVLESGPPAQIRASPAVRNAYLGDAIDDTLT